MFPKRKNVQLDETIDAFQFILTDEILDPKERLKVADQLIQLHTIQTANARTKVSADTLATIAANLAGILIIVKHEQANVIASKALGFVAKLR